MKKSRWLTLVGVGLIICALFVGLSSGGELMYPITIMGFIVVGLGEILFHLKNGGKG